MPSISHEGLVALFRHRPALAAELLRDVLHVEIPDYAEIRIEDSDLTQLQPAQFTADLVVLLRRGAPVLVIVVEVQLAVDPDKLYSWPLYLTATRARYRCPSIVLVITATETVARWAADPVDLGAGYRWAPLVVGPKLVPIITEPTAATADPELAVLSALAHGNDATVGFDVLVAALGAALGLDDDRARLYHDVVLATLSEATRIALEKHMSTGRYEFQSEFAKKHQALGRAEGKAEGKAEGRAEGKAEDILRVLEARGLTVTSEERARVLATTDLETLDRWLVRAVTASIAAEVFVD